MSEEDDHVFVEIFSDQLLTLISNNSQDQEIIDAITNLSKIIGDLPSRYDVEDQLIIFIEDFRNNPNMINNNIIRRILEIWETISNERMDHINHLPDEDHISPYTYHNHPHPPTPHQIDGLQFYADLLRFTPDLFNGNNNSNTDDSTTPTDNPTILHIPGNIYNTES